MAAPKRWGSRRFQSLERIHPQRPVGDLGLRLTRGRFMHGRAQTLGQPYSNTWNKHSIKADEQRNKKKRGEKPQMRAEDESEYERQEKKSEELTSTSAEM